MSEAVPNPAPCACGAEPALIHESYYDDPAVLCNACGIGAWSSATLREAITRWNALQARLLPRLEREALP